MKRLITISLVLASFGVLCFGRYASRGSSRKPALRIIQLAEPRLDGPMSLEQALLKRRSVRRYEDRALSFSQIGQLAWAGQGITEPTRGLRTAPSAGETYPIELHFVLPEGIFVYRPGNHSLEQTGSGDVRGELAAAASMQQAVARAPCSIVVAGSARKLLGRFRDKAKTYMLLEAGHVAQNIQLQAVALGLGSVTIGGISSQQVARVVRLPKASEAVYVICVGYPVAEPPAAARKPEEVLRQLAVPGRLRAVFIIPSVDFRDDELAETQRVLELAGVETTIASSRRGSIKGMLGNTAEATVMLNELQVDDYDAVIFIGGPGVEEYFEDPVAQNIAREAAKDKVVAAVSAAPVILANAGILVGKRVTGFLSEQQRLQQAGAVFTGAMVERHGTIITCVGPVAIREFGMAIFDAMLSRRPGPGLPAGDSSKDRNGAGTASR